jgi:hypothetical protein
VIDSGAAGMFLFGFKANRILTNKWPKKRIAQLIKLSYSKQILNPY